MSDINPDHAGNVLSDDEDDDEMAYIKQNMFR